MTKNIKDFTDKDVKKRAKPRLDSGWWKTAWPHPTPPKSNRQMVLALKDTLKKRVKALDAATGTRTKRVATGAGIATDLALAAGGFADAHAALQSLCAAERAAMQAQTYAAAGTDAANTVKDAMVELAA